MTDFLDLSLYLWELLVMQLLPLCALIVLMIYIYLIMDASGKTLKKFLSKKLKNAFPRRK